MYNCSKLGENDYNCSLRESDKSPDAVYYFYIKYTGNKIAHEDKELPLQKKYISDYYYFSFGESMNFYYQKWKTIKYTEDKGIFGALNFIGKSKEYFGGVMMNDKIAIADMPEEWINANKEKGMKILSGLQINFHRINFCENYTRSKKTLLEPISNICSLSLTIYSIFIFVYCGFFSNNFDNYKIIEKILMKNKRQLFNNKEKSKKDKTIKLS